MKDEPNGTVVITYGFPENAALAANIDRLVPILTTLRPPVRLITYCDPALISTLDDGLIEQLPEYRSPLVKFFLGQVNLALALIRSGRTSRADTLFFAFGGDLSLLPVILGRLLGYKIVMRSDGRPTSLLRYFPGTSRLKILGFRAIEAAIYRLTDLLLTESAYMIDANEFAAHRPEVGPLPITPERFSDPPPFDKRPFDLVVAGRHTEQKGFDQLIDALPRLHREHPTLKTLIIGDGPLHGGMKEKLGAEGLGDRIVLAGWVAREELPRCLMNARMLLLPSRYEGLPNIILEAMASGTLVLATAVGGIPGIVSDGETGFLISACTSDAICECVQRALINPDIASIVDRARGEILENYSYDNVLRRYDTLLEELDRRAGSR